MHFHFFTLLNSYSTHVISSVLSCPRPSHSLTLCYLPICLSEHYYLPTQLAVSSPLLILPLNLFVPFPSPPISSITSLSNDVITPLPKFAYHLHFHLHFSRSRCIRAFSSSHSTFFPNHPANCPLSIPSLLFSSSLFLRSLPLFSLVSLAFYFLSPFLTVFSLPFPFPFLLYLSLFPHFPLPTLALPLLLVFLPFPGLSLPYTPSLSPPRPGHLFRAAQFLHT